MKRDNAREIETPFGTFYGGIMESLGEKGPTFYAETESGEVTVNGVTYRGTVYGDRLSYNNELYISVRHLTRWDDKRGHFYPASDSAQAKLAAVLLPVFEEWASDGDYIRARQVSSLTSSHGYAVRDVNDAICKANVIAAQLRALGADVSDIPMIAVSL